MSTILGLSFFYHDSAAALVQDGQIVAAAAEERFTRRKHTNEFPKQALSFCLAQANLESIGDLDAIVFYEKPIRKFVRVVDTLVAYWPRTIGQFCSAFPTYLKSKLNIRRSLTQELPAYSGPLLFSEHHLSHAAAAFYCSPFDEAAILTADGVGEWETTTLGWGRGTDLRLERSIHYPHSVGLLFSALTAYLGFRVNDAEWKVMGLAPYGEPSLVDRCRQLVSVKDDGSFHLNLDFFAHQYSTTTTANEREWARLFGFPRRGEGEPIEDHHRDLARSGQQVLEELMIGMAKEAKRATPWSRYLVIGGGVGLNSVANGKIQQAGIFEDVWIQPAAGDDGGALGAAVAASVLRFGEERPAPLDHMYLGPEYNEDEIRFCLEAEGIAAERMLNDELVDRVADLLADGQVIGWFDGRMEFGPRSLGARSILASPSKAEMKEKVNRSVKFREPFRPFAPAVLQERAHEYFDISPNTSLPFMTKVVSVRPEKRAEIPAITHIDGTGRVQTVRRQDNPRFYRLIKAFAERTGTPVLLNTSFNVRGEPIVCTPYDAIDCFRRSGMDGLVLGGFFVRRTVDRPVDASEGYASSDRIEADLARPSAPVPVRDRARLMPRSAVRVCKDDPFADYANAVDLAKSLMRKNQIKQYPLLHRHLKRAEAPQRVLDVGSGSGWFVNSCSYFYGHDVTGIETNPVAVKYSKDVARLMSTISSRFFVGDIFQFVVAEPFDLVNCFGGPHGTEDGETAIRKMASWTRNGGVLHLCLDESHARSTVLDNHHFYVEIHRILTDCGLEVEAKQHVAGVVRVWARRKLTDENRFSTGGPP